MLSCQGLEIIFNDRQLVQLLFSPLLELNPCPAAPDYIYQQLVLIFQQPLVDLDIVIANTLGKERL